MENGKTLAEQLIKLANSIRRGFEANGIEFPQPTPEQLDALARQKREHADFITAEIRRHEKALLN